MILINVFTVQLIHLYNQKMYTAIFNKTAIGTPNENDNKIEIDIGIATYPHGTDMPFIKYFDDKNKYILILLEN